MTKIKKIIAIITTFSFLFTAAGPAMSATIEELQAQIAALLAQIATLQAQLSGMGAGTGTITGCSISSFSRNLKIGMSGDDVKCLQIVLNSDASTQVAASGVGSSGNETNYFGSLTNAAVIKFQEKYASEVLATYGLTSGTGFVGTTTRAKLNSLLSAGAGTGTGAGETGTAATVSLSADTPVASQTALAAQDVVFAKVKFTAGASAYTVSTIYITRSGVAADADVSAIKLYDGTTQLGSTQALNTTTHKASFTGLNWTIPAYSVKYLTIKGSIAASGTATVGDSIKLGIYAATDITSTVTPSGTFPIWSNAMTIAGISVGELFVAKKTSPATTTILSGATDQEIACWDFTATNTEGFNVHSIKVSQVGTASREDLPNVKLKVTGVQIGSTVSQFDTSNGATFDLSSSPLSILAGTTKTVCAFADIGSGIWTSRTAIFEITQYTDIVAYGANSGGAVTVSYDDTTSFYKQTGNEMTIGQGVLAVAIDASQNPSTQTYVKGTTNRLITALKFSTGSVEGARVVKLRLTLGGTLAAATDLSNVTLWDGTTQIGSASVIGSYVTFGANTVGWDTSSLFDIEASKVKTILVKADVPTGANTNHTVKLSIALASDVWADGLNSRYDLPSSSITGAATGNAHNISSSGNLAVSLSSQTPSAQTYVIGATGQEFTRINLTADSGEDIDVTSIILDLFSNRIAATSGAHFTNVKLVKEDGTQFGSTQANPIATASFSGSLTVPASQTVTLKAIGDIPSSSYPEPNGSMSVASTTAIASALTSTGRASMADITETGSAVGNTMTIGQAGLTVSAAAAPADQSIIVGSSEVALVGLVFEASTAENIRVTSVTLTQSSSAGEGSTTDVSYLALYDGSTRLTAKESLTEVAANRNYVTFSGADWLNGIGLDISKGQQKTLTVKGDIPATGVANHTFAIGVSSTDDVVFTGLLSNTTPTPTVSGTTGANYHYTRGSVAANCYESTLTSAGVLTINTSADTPIEGIQSVGTVGLANVPFLKTYFAASMEPIYIKSITIESQGHPTSTNPATFASVSLWDGSTQLGSAQAINTNASTTFNFAAGNYWEIPTVGAKYLTIKASLNGVRDPYSSGSVTGDNVYLCIDRVTVQGKSSGSTSLTVNGGTSGIIDECDNAYRQTVRQSKPTIALASPTSGTYGGGQQELLRWTVSADDLSDIGWRKIIFDVTGGVILTSGGSSYTVGSSPAAQKSDGIYMSTTTTWGDAIASGVKQLIATSTMQVWDVGSNTEVTGLGSGVHAWTVDQETSTGTARVTFVASTEQVVSAGTSKTYKFLGDVLQGSGQPGSSLSTKIAARTTGTNATSTDNYANIAATTANFVWSDRSGGSYAAHSFTTGDWTSEYKVSGLPTATKTLSK